MEDEILGDGAPFEDDGVNGFSDGHPIVMIDDALPPQSDTQAMNIKPQKKPKAKPRASVLEYKTVNEMYDTLCSYIIFDTILTYSCPRWDRKSYGRKIVESLDKDSGRTDKYEEYIFVERRRYGTLPVFSLG